MKPPDSETSRAIALGMGVVCGAVAVRWAWWGLFEEGLETQHKRTLAALGLSAGALAIVHHGFGIDYKYLTIDWLLEKIDK